MNNVTTPQNLRNARQLIHIPLNLLMYKYIFINTDTDHAGYRATSVTRAHAASILNTVGNKITEFVFRLFSGSSKLFR